MQAQSPIHNLHFSGFWLWQPAENCRGYHWEGPDGPFFWGSSCKVCISIIWSIRNIILYWLDFRIAQDQKVFIPQDMISEQTLQRFVLYSFEDSFYFYSRSFRKADLPDGFPFAFREYAFFGRQKGKMGPPAYYYTKVCINCNKNWYTDWTINSISMCISLPDCISQIMTYVF